MKYLIYVLSILIISCSDPTSENFKISNSIYDYIDSDNITSIRVEYYDSLSSNSLDTIINNHDKNDITTVKNYLKLIPDEGQIMVSMGECPVTEIIFMEENVAIDTLKYYGTGLKSPKGTFYIDISDVSQNAISDLYNLITSWKL